MSLPNLGSSHKLETDGYLVIEKFVPVDKLITPLWQEIHSICELVGEKLGIPVEEFSGSDQTSEFITELARINRRHVGILYDQVKQLPAFLSLVSWNGFRQLFAALRGAPLVGTCNNGYGVRFDLPDEDSWRSHWHQEYAYNPQSIDALTFWLPLLPVEEDMGPVQILEGSHKLGHIRHQRLAKYSRKVGLYQIGIPQEEQYTELFRTVAPLTRPGDLLCFGFDTIHQSGFNTSQKLRASFQIRMFNFVTPSAIEAGWPSDAVRYFGYENAGDDQ